MCIHILLSLLLKVVLGQIFEILPEYMPYISLNQSQQYNYGYWFKYQPLTQFTTQFTQEKSFGNSTNKNYLDNEYLISAELSNENTLCLWHVQTDKFDHIIFIVQKNGIQSYVFSQDLLQYEGIWNFFGVQVISDSQYQIIFYSNRLTISNIDGEIKRTQYQIGGYGTFLQDDGSQMHFQQFKGKLTNFIEFNQIVTESNFDDQVLILKQDYLDTIQTMKNQYFDILNFDGQSVIQYQFVRYREGIRYAISMWVKSNIEQYSSPLNYSIFRASLNNKLSDSYLGDKQLFIQYQIGIVPQENIVFAMTYSFQTPIYQLQRKNVNDWIKIQDLDLIKGLKQWHFIQFEYGRTSLRDASPPKYNSLFTLILPNDNKQFNQDWGRDNHHFTGSPIYFYLGGSLSQHENKFVGSISQFTFISYNTLDLHTSIQCHFTCLTCNGPTSSDCLKCSAEKNRVLTLNQCVCLFGYVNGLTDSCQQVSSMFEIIKIIETEYNCPEGYDQCQDRIVCSFGYFNKSDKCYKCPQQPSQIDINIYCVECVLYPNQWNGQCISNMIQLDFNIFSLIERDYFSYEQKIYNDTLELVPKFQFSLGCEKGYGLDYYSSNCIRCQNCLTCEYLDYFQICMECPSYYYQQDQNCVICGSGCEQCDSNRCLKCEEGTFLTLDMINCVECSIQYCDYCYQQYYDPMTNKVSISLDIKFNQVDLSLEGIFTGCARCHDGFAIQGNKCVEYQNELCITGIFEEDQFVCLIGYDQETRIQQNNCNLIENCYSCFVSYPIDPWCVQCMDGYYVQFVDGSCIACPDICASCIYQNPLFKDSWKINVRAFYYYKFGQHLFEDYAMDTYNYQYNIVCTVCKDNYILYEDTCIPECGQNCEVCEAKDGKAVCLKCQDNQYGPILSLDQEKLCLECPQKCQACTQRDENDIKKLNKYFDSQITNNEHKCYLQTQGYFLDQEFNLPVKCENSIKCFKSLIVQLDIYCNSDFIKDVSNCKIDNIQQCLVDIFTLEMIDYTSKLLKSQKQSQRLKINCAIWVKWKQANSQQDQYYHQKRQHQNCNLQFKVYQKYNLQQQQATLVITLSAIQLQNRLVINILKQLVNNKISYLNQQRQ